MLQDAANSNLWVHATQAGLLALLLANIVSVLRGLKRTFVMGTPTWHGWLIRIGSPVTWASGVAGIILAPAESAGSLVIAVTAFIGSWFLFRAATRATQSNRFTWAFSTDVPGQLVKTGPYQWVRHPFYSSYLLLAWGSVFATSAKTWVAVPAVALTIIYFLAIRFEEEKFSRSPLAEAYAHYKAAVGMLIPRPWRQRVETNSHI